MLWMLENKTLSSERLVVTQCISDFDRISTAIANSPLSSRRLSPGSSHQRAPEQAERWIPGIKPGMTGCAWESGSTYVGNVLGPGVQTRGKRCFGTEDHVLRATAGIDGNPGRRQRARLPGELPADHVGRGIGGVTLARGDPRCHRLRCCAQPDAAERQTEGGGHRLYRRSLLGGGVDGIGDDGVSGLQCALRLPQEHGVDLRTGFARVGLRRQALGLLDTEEAFAL